MKKVGAQIDNTVPESFAYAKNERCMSPRHDQGNEYLLFDAISLLYFLKASGVRVSGLL